MPSPIAHAAMGYVLYHICRPRKRQKCPKHIGPVPVLLAITVDLSILPDVDSVFGILIGDLGRFHNNVMNTPVFGLLVAVSVGALVWLRQRSGFAHWFIIAVVCYELHVIMDFFTMGRGVMILWPFLSERFESPVRMFYGLHWSEGWISAQHLWTLVTEMGFIVLICFLTHVLMKGKQGCQDTPTSRAEQRSSRV